MSRPAAPRRGSVRWRRRLAVLGLGLGAWLAAVLSWSALREQVGHPDPAASDAWHQGHRIVDRQGRLLRELPTDHGRRGRPLALPDMGARLVTATVVSEDADFFAHDGLDRGAILRAAVQNVTHARLVSGASTITQQLVKLLDSRGVPGQRTLGIKIDEAARAQNLESALTKAEILVQYINRLPYGHGLVGPEAAAQGYFGVAAHELSWAQAAFLAVLPRAPARLDPYAHLPRALDRQRKLLHALHEQGHLDHAALSRALGEAITPRAITHAFAAPHFVERLRQEDRLAEGPVTTTTLDLALQQDIEGLLTTHMATMVDFGAHDAAVLVLDNDTAQVLAWVGSSDFFDADIAGQVDMVSSRRQPGSTLKPFVYALAFAGGLTSADMLPDVPTTFREGPGHPYVPHNFHDEFSGPVAARDALAASLNVPAVRLLANEGADSLLALLRGLGMESLTADADHYGLSLALGSGEVTMRELAGAYATLARGGTYLPLRYTDAEPTVAPRRWIEPTVAAAVTEALADPLARARLVPGRSPFAIGFPVAVKTGTSTGYRDAWTAGYTRERTVVVWLGNADGGPTQQVTGARGAGGLFADVMRRAMLDVPTHAPLWAPDLLETAHVCALTGKRPGEACPHAVARRFPRGGAPTEHCAAHVHARRDAGGWACDPAGPDTLVVLPEAYEAWLHTLPSGAPGKDPDGLAWLAASDVPGCAGSSAAPPSLRIVEPGVGAVVWVTDAHDRVEIVADVHGDPTFAGAVEFVVDGRVVATARPVASDRDDAPRAAWRALVSLPPGDHEVLARPVDPTAHFSLTASTFAVR